MSEVPLSKLEKVLMSLGIGIKDFAKSPQKAQYLSDKIMRGGEKAYHAVTKAPDAAALGAGGGALATYLAGKFGDGDGDESEDQRIKQLLASRGY